MSTVALKVLLGTLFFGFSCVAFLSMLHLLGSPHTPHAKTLRILHRFAGGFALVLYIVITLMCVALLLRQDGELSPRGAIHFTFAALFIPLILLKILVVEKYPELRNRLLAVGTALFAVAFLVFFTSSAFYLISGSAEVETEPYAHVGKEVWAQKQLFVAKCAKCHRLDRPLSAMKTPEQWESTVDRMRQKDPAWLSEQEAIEIKRFLVSLEQ